MSLSVNVRKATLEDVEELLTIYEKARAFQKKTGNPNQWKDDYPSKELLLQDIEREELFVIEKDKLVGVFMLTERPEPTYENVYEGSFKSEAYVTIHRIASTGEVSGITDIAVNFSRKKGMCVRMDTHRDNLVMQRALSRLGFTYAGIIYLKNGDERFAYELLHTDGFER
ncbi:GNAT family N-acetyltransferase [Guggenheimella bovis]